MKIIDKLLDRLADKVFERMENKNTVMINGEKMKAQIEKQKYDDEMVQRILKGNKVRISKESII